MTRSLGLKTDLMLLRDSVIDEHEGAVRVRTPAQPDFYFGNFLLFARAPRAGEAASWVEQFGRAFAGEPG